MQACTFTTFIVERERERGIGGNPNVEGVETLQEVEEEKAERETCSNIVSYCRVFSVYPSHHTACLAVASFPSACNMNKKLWHKKRWEGMRGEKGFLSSSFLSLLPPKPLRICMPPKTFRSPLAHLKEKTAMQAIHYSTGKL